ncbi:hypothetical protein OIU79_000579 [Salix purpurea]|uniref:Uncharacterized protein n=1 Tax=Salix purpurea TaxID=77065 RepID=A0A9Q0V2D6_SALPP|nr:hypothetical protein OIU79_000579 [Salix purpurea]
MLCVLWISLHEMASCIRGKKPTMLHIHCFELSSSVSSAMTRRVPCWLSFQLLELVSSGSVGDPYSVCPGLSWYWPVFHPATILGCLCFGILFLSLFACGHGITRIRDNTKPSMSLLGYSSCL